MRATWPTLWRTSSHCTEEYGISLRAHAQGLLLFDVGLRIGLMFGRLRPPISSQLIRFLVVVTAVIGVGSCARGGDREQCLMSCFSNMDLQFEPSIRQPGNYVVALGGSRCVITLPAVSACRSLRDGAVVRSHLPASLVPRALDVRISGDRCDVELPTMPACLTLRRVHVTVGSCPSLPRALHVAVARDGEEVINGDAELWAYRPFETCGMECAHAAFIMPVPPGPLRFH